MVLFMCRWAPGLLPLVTLSNDAAVNMGEQMSLQVPASPLWVMHPEVELLDHTVILHLTSG